MLDLPRGLHAELEEAPQAIYGAETPTERSALREDIPDQGRNQAGALRSVRYVEGPDAPRRLPEADEGPVAMPEASSRASREDGKEA